VNDDYLGGGAEQIHPTVWVDEAGHVHVAFLDRRDDPANLKLAVYLATSTNGGVSFGPNVRISDPGFVQGGLPGRLNTWLGDYIGGVGAGGKNHVVWADGRNGDLDIFYRAVYDADFDADGIANDGSGDGQYANAPCTGGLTAGCDDNCPGSPIRRADSMGTASATRATTVRASQRQPVRSGLRWYRRAPHPCLERERPRCRR
jgi:hypothetical protein